MSNIRVNVNYTIKDGSEIVFRSPVDCSAITGLIVYYKKEDGKTTSKVFALADAHGNNVGDIDHLFTANVVVKVILDVTRSMAFVQNADTNAYLEEMFASKAPAGYGLGVYTDSLTPVADCNNAALNGWYFINSSTANSPFASTTGAMRVDTHSASHIVQTAYSGAFSATGMVCKRRTRINGAWGEWEWENPPMETGVEYRTTERFRGQPVYKKLIDFGYTAAGQNTLTHGLSVNVPISIQLLNQYSENITHSGDVAGVFFDRTRIIFEREYANGGAVALVSYTKT